MLIFVAEVTCTTVKSDLHGKHRELTFIASTYWLHLKSFMWQMTLNLLKIRREILVSLLTDSLLTLAPF